MRELPHTRTHAVPQADDEIGYIIPLTEWDEEAPWLQNAPKRWYGEVNSAGPETCPADQ